MYYNITTDLKEIFQTTKDSHEKKDMACVDCDEEKAKEVHVPTAPVTGAEQPSGFTFSFFDSDTKDVKEGIFFFFLLFHTRQLKLNWVYVKYNDLTLAEETILSCT